MADQDQAKSEIQMSGFNRHYSMLEAPVFPCGETSLSEQIVIYKQCHSTNPYAQNIQNKMPRARGNQSSGSSSGGGFFSRSSAAPASPARAPAMHHQTPPPAHHAPQQSGGMMSGLGGALATGMAMGAGSEIAHQAIRGVMGSGSSSHGGQPAQQQQAGAPVQYAQPAAQQQYEQQQNPCMNYNQMLLTCMKDNTSNIGMCQTSMDMLTQCEKDNARFFGY